MTTSRTLLFENDVVGLGMELRQLRSFIAAAEEGNISRAAERLHVTQPALSRQIKALEEDLGVTLLERGAHSFRLTREGEVMLREGRAVVARVDQAVGRVRAAGQVVTLRVGYAPSLTAGILAPAMAAFTQRHPLARVELLDLSSVEMEAGLAQEGLDLAVMVEPQKVNPSVEWVRLREEPWRVVLNAGHPLLKKAVLGPEDLHRERLVLYCQREYPEYWRLVSQWFKEQRIDARVVGEYDGVNSLVSAVEAGLGVALVVERSARMFSERVMFRSLEPTPTPVSIAAGRAVGRREEAVLGVLVEEMKRAALGGEG